MHKLLAQVGALAKAAKQVNAAQMVFPRNGIWKQSCLALLGRCFANHTYLKPAPLQLQLAVSVHAVVPDMTVIRFEAAELHGQV